MEETSPATHGDEQVNDLESRKPTDASNRTSKSADRKHGKSFVYIGLKDCDDALRKIDPSEQQMSIEGFARALRHKEPKGRFLHKLDAMERFTLIEKDAESVRLTNLAIDMLYGGSEAAKSRARAAAFLAYHEFKRVFVECPKGEDNQRSHIEEFVTAKLGIRNDVARFIRLFLESAHFAGLLEGAPNPSAKTFRLRAAPATVGMGLEAAATNAPAHDEYSPLPIEDVETCLESVGLSEYGNRSEVRQRSVGKIKLEVSEGRITVTVDRPVRIVIKTNDALAELQQILASMQAKGLKA